MLVRRFGAVLLAVGPVCTVCALHLSATNHPPETPSVQSLSAPPAAPVEDILDFDADLEADRGVVLHAQVYVGPVVRLETRLHSFPAGTLVRPVSYVVRVRSGAPPYGHAAGMLFRPIAENRGLGGGISIAAAAHAEGLPASRAFLSWRIELPEGQTWGELARAEDLAFTSSWSEASEPDRSKGVPTVPTPR